MLSIGGQEINGVTSESLHRLTGYVPQETFLFSRSVAENIAYGIGESHTIEAVTTAAGQAGMMQDIDTFPEKFGSQVGEKGITLSGGQKQRLSLARAIAGNPRLLLLDDPLSAVDAGREEEILNELSKFYSGRTSLIVSQRVSAFRDCDRIIVLNGGEIVEQGAPGELLQQDGLYADMYHRQQGTP